MGRRSVALVVAHPDDDAYGIAGTVALHDEDPDFRFVLVHATDGEAGDIREGFPATRETLGAVRRAEDEAAWKAVGRVPDRHEWLGFPDGQVSDVPFEELVSAIAIVLAEEKPDVVVTFGPDGIFGHPDHITVGAATDAAFNKLAADNPETGFRRLLHCAISQSVFDRWQDQRRQLGLELWDPDRMYHMRAVPDDRIGVTVDCRPVATRIVDGLKQHASQLHVMTDYPLNEERWARIVTREWYAIAWPPPPPGAAMLADIFEGLD